MQQKTRTFVLAFVALHLLPPQVVSMVAGRTLQPEVTMRTLDPRFQLLLRDYQELLRLVQDALDWDPTDVDLERLELRLSIYVRMLELEPLAAPLPRTDPDGEGGVH